MCSHECVVVELVSYISESMHDVMFKINSVSESVDGSVPLLLLRQHRVLIGSFGRANRLCLCPSPQQSPYSLHLCASVHLSDSLHIRSAIHCTLPCTSNGAAPNWGR